MYVKSNTVTVYDAMRRLVLPEISQSTIRNMANRLRNTGTNPIGRNSADDKSTPHHPITFIYGIDNRKKSRPLTARPQLNGLQRKSSADAAMNRIHTANCRFMYHSEYGIWLPLKISTDSPTIKEMLAKTVMESNILRDRDLPIF